MGLRFLLYWTTVFLPLLFVHRKPLAVEIDPIDTRVRELCEKLADAQESEVLPLLSELRTALRKHAQYVRYMALRAASRSPTSASRVAD